MLPQVHDPILWSSLLYLERQYQQISVVNPGATTPRSKFDWSKSGAWSNAFTTAIGDPERYQHSNPHLYV